MTRDLHIIALDSPWPADYGGAIDMYCRLEALHKAGIRIHLHYFCYNQRGNPNELNRFCESIHIYERKTGHKGFSFRLPYIVASRINEELISNLKKDNYPILAEGVHCTGLLNELNTGNRKIVVRLHNDESDYYKQLAASTKQLFRKFYYLNESRLLKKYQRNLPEGLQYACISKSDVSTFRNEYKLKDVFLLPAFVPYQNIDGQEGIGNFCLYHGNLSVPENEKAAAWLLTRVFTNLKIPLVIAGKNPSKRLDKLAHLCQHTCLVADPTSSEIDDLIRKAHINIIPSFSTTGVKLKLLHALFKGRHCVTNEAMVKDTGLEAACHTGSTAQAMASIIMQLHHQPYTHEETVLRNRLVGGTYDNEKNAAALIQYLY